MKFNPLAVDLDGSLLRSDILYELILLFENFCKESAEFITAIIVATFEVKGHQ
jgi:hypothetical protein